jgi:hypothetical protein
LSSKSIKSAICRENKNVAQSDAVFPRPQRSTPRKQKLHKLSNIVMIVLCAVLSGIEDWVGMEEFAEEYVKRRVGTN